MNRLRILLFFICAAVVSTVWAASISESQARAIATKFMAQKAIPSSQLKLARKATRLSGTPTQDNAAYYVFNSAERGYVIIAGDDRAPAVLGYSDRGTFDNQDVPEGLQDLLEGYSAQIEALVNGAKPALQLQSAAAIRPLLKATWGQGSPYNTLLPILPSNSHAYVGCVGTAMAQVMHYWKWPARPTRSIPAYTSLSITSNGNTKDTLKYDMPELPVIDFNWDAMQNTYLTNDTESAEALAAATLNLYCDQALQMTFKRYSSSASTAIVPCEAATYFDYDARAHMESRHNHSSEGWFNLLYAEISAGRPVIFSARKKDGGHAFICDGYDGNGLFHFNWGWNGMSNGYFLLNVLNPDEQGTGSADGAYGYIMEQAAIVGFQPNQGGTHGLEITATQFKFNSYIGTRENTTDYFRVNVSTEFRNYTSDTLNVRFGWGLFQDGNFIETLYSRYDDHLEPGHYHDLTNINLNFGANKPSGTYRILPMYCKYGTEDWHPCIGADRNYIELTIDGNQCTFTGYGTAGIPNYTINNIAMVGYMHNGRPINIDVNMTNNGLSSNELLYMFINGTFAAVGYVGLETGETGDIHYTYLFDNPGDYTITWSWNENGSDPIATSIITINPMPAASLSSTIKVLNVTDNENDIITSKKFSVELTITNNGTTTYDEDISVSLFKKIYGNTGTNVQGLNQRLVLGPNESATMQFDMDNVIDGWKYFAKSYYYSEGNQVNLNTTYTYTIVFPNEPEVKPGDVDGNGAIEIKDVSALIDYLLTGDATGINLANADVNRNSEVTIADVSALIDFLLEN